MAPLRLRVADALEAGGDGARAEKLRRCGEDWQVLADWQGHGRAVAVGCDDLFCPDCAPRLAGAAAAHVAYCTQEARRAGLRLAHVVLTVPDSASLSAADIAQLHRAVSLLWRQRPVQAALAGLYRATEITWTAGRGYHPHVHCLAALAPGFDADYGDFARDLAMRWHGLTGCSADCDTKRRSLEGSLEGTPGCSQGGSVWVGSWLDPTSRAAGEIAYEVSKYVVKPASYQRPDGTVAPQIGAVSLALRGQRRRQGYGCFHGCTAPTHPAAPCERCDARNRRALAPDGDRSQLVDPTWYAFGSLRLVDLRCHAGDGFAQAVWDDLVARREGPFARPQGVGSPADGPSVTAGEPPF